MTGIHHITAIADDPQRTIDFYTKVMGLRLVKLTVNLDDPRTYHFYFGNETGTQDRFSRFFRGPARRTGAQAAGRWLPLRSPRQSARCGTGIGACGRAR